jgi:hypothetical protein
MNAMVTIAVSAQPSAFRRTMAMLVKKLPPIEIAHPENNEAADNQSAADIAEGWVSFGGSSGRGEVANAKDFVFILNADLGEEKAEDPQDDRNDAGPGRFVHMVG